jgi:hypothetical protein
MSEEDLKKHGPLPEEDEWRQQFTEAWINFPEKRFRVETKGKAHFVRGDGTAPLIPIHRVNLFDGVSLQSDRGNDELEHHLGSDLHAVVFATCTLPLFWGMGIVFEPDTPLHANKLKNAVDPRKFRIHDVQRAGGSTCLTVRANMRPDHPKSYLQYVIDLDKDCAVVAYSYISEDRLWSEMNVEWSETDSGWQPVSWKDATFRPDGTPFISGRFDVVERVIDPDLSQIQFHINLTPGSRYWDKKSNQTYIKSADGKPDILSE